MAGRQALILTSVAVGGVLVFEGFKGRSAWDDFLSIIRGEELKPDGGSTTAAPASPTAGGGSSSWDTGKANPGSQTMSKAALIAEQQRLTKNDMVQLQDINGVPMNAYLLPDAAKAFQRAQKRVGRTIPLTSGWRDIQSEMERNKTDPKRWPIPNGHTAGTAIDVWGDNLEGWANAPARDTTVRAALLAEGFLQWNPDGWDFMHFNFGKAI